MLMANKYFSDLSKIKMVEALKFYVFHERRNKKMAKYRSMLNWAKNTKLKTLLCLKANSQIRKEKKIKMAKAFSDRDRMIKQNALWKLINVGKYWHEKRGYMSGLEAGPEHFEQHLMRTQKKAGLFRWISYVMD